MTGVIQDYAKTIQTDFQLVFNHIKKGCPKSDNKQGKITHAAIRALLVPVIAIVAIHFVVSLVTGSIASVIYLIGIGVLLHDIYQWCKNKSPSYLGAVTEVVAGAVQKTTAYLWTDKSLLKNTPSHRWTRNMILRPLVDIVLYNFFPNLCRG